LAATPVERLHKARLRIMGPAPRQREKNISFNSQHLGHVNEVSVCLDPSDCFVDQRQTLAILANCDKALNE
jgi:hypothetical protein